jgi:predicted Zn-dependent protease
MKTVAVLVLLLAALCSLVGCATTDCYELVIDPDFTPDQQAAIKEAMGEWETALGGELTVTSEPIAKCVTATGHAGPHQICVHATTEAAMGNASEAAKNVGSGLESSADVYFPVDRDGAYTHEDFVMIAAHELGHSMGLRHTQAGTLMFWNEAGGGRTVTAADVAQWLAAHGQPNAGGFVYDTEH